MKISKVFVDNYCSAQSSSTGAPGRSLRVLVCLSRQKYAVYIESEYTVAAASERAAAKETVDRARRSHLLVAFDSFRLQSIIGVILQLRLDSVKKKLKQKNLIYYLAAVHISLISDWTL